MILKTYLRVFTEDAEQSLQLLKALTGKEPDIRFSMPYQGLEIIAIEDICLVAGSAVALDPIRSLQGPLIVDDLDAVTAILLRHGAVITKDEDVSPSGRYLFARHADGLDVEYVQWKQELVDRIIGRPRSGRLECSL
jgi:hypothetical protein